MATFTKLRAEARDLMEEFPILSRRQALVLAGALPAKLSIYDLEITALSGQPVLLLPGWVADDGNQEVEYPAADDGGEAAEEYVADGDWGNDGGSVNVRAWRRGIVVRDGDTAEEIEVYSEWHDVDLDQDHEALIAATVSRYDRDSLCGLDPGDHEWTSQGEGGCTENPGVWSHGGTALSFSDHCRACGLRRFVRDPGSQRNPGDGVVTSYEMADEERIAAWRRAGYMEEVDEDDEDADD